MRNPACGPVEGAAVGTAARFLGLPFALPPTGALRFAAPVRPAPWTRPRQALTFGPTAAQPDRGVTLIPEPTQDGDDILNLNIFAPANLPDTPLPVLVYIHGGGYFGGCNRSEWFDGTTFVKKGVVFVAPNYRLSVEGFMPVAGAPDNRGLLDWIAALEWVQDNIAAFGGDPGRVTVAGQSAGAGAVATLMAAPAARGLFHRAVLFSGSIGFGGSMDRAKAFAQRFAKATGVAATATALADMPKPALIAGYAAGMDDPSATAPAAGFVNTMILGLPLQPLAGTESLPLAPHDAMTQGASADIPVFVSVTRDEFVFEVDPHGKAITEAMVEEALSRMGLDAADQKAWRGLYPGYTASRLLGQAVTDLVFRAPMLRLASLRKARGAAPSWLAEYRWQSPVVLNGVMRAAHCLDMPFYFDKLALPSAQRVLGRDAPTALGAEMHAALVAFIHGESPGWQDWARSGKVRLWDAPQVTDSAEMDALARIFG